MTSPAVLITGIEPLMMHCDLRLPVFRHCVIMVLLMTGVDREGNRLLQLSQTTNNCIAGHALAATARVISSITCSYELSR